MHFTLFNGSPYKSQLYSYINFIFAKFWNGTAATISRHHIIQAYHNDNFSGAKNHEPIPKFAFRIAFQHFAVMNGAANVVQTSVDCFPNQVQQCSAWLLLRTKLRKRSPLRFSDKKQSRQVFISVGITKYDLKVLQDSLSQEWTVDERNLLRCCLFSLWGMRRWL